MKTVHLTIAGMHCNGCVENVRKRLAETPGVRSADVRLNAADVRIDAAVCGITNLVAAVSGAGDFQVISFVTEGE